MIARALVTLALVLNGVGGNPLFLDPLPGSDPVSRAAQAEMAEREAMYAPDVLPRPAPPLDVEWLTPEPPQKLKVLLVRFWNVDCETCVATLPELQTLQQRYRKRGLVVVGIHMSQHKKGEDRAVREALAQQEITFPVAQDRDGEALNLWWLFRPRPTKSFTALVDAKGRIRWMRASTDREKPKWEKDLKDLEKEIRKLLLER